MYSEWHTTRYLETTQLSITPKSLIQLTKADRHEKKPFAQIALFISRKESCPRPTCGNKLLELLLALSQVEVSLL